MSTARMKKRMIKKLGYNQKRLMRMYKVKTVKELIDIIFPNRFYLKGFK
jgi:hypothetical protein